MPKPCRTFRNFSEFKTFTSPASRQAPGDSAASPTTGKDGASSVPLWRIELLRRPLRKVVAWSPFTIPASKRHRLPPCEMYRETLECGHKMRRMVSWDPPAKRRRCRECGGKA
jgi:hypothetical protein